MTVALVDFKQADHDSAHKDEVHDAVSTALYCGMLAETAIWEAVGRAMDEYAGDQKA